MVTVLKNYMSNLCDLLLYPLAADADANFPRPVHEWFAAKSAWVARHYTHHKLIKYMCMRTDTRVKGMEKLG